LPEALAAVDRALGVQPGFAEALYVKANVLRDLGRTGEALEAYEATLKSNPAHPHALNGAAQVARIVCDFKRVEALTPQVIQNAPGGRAVIQPFVLMGYSDDAALQRRCAENLVRMFVPQRPALRDVRRYGHDRIRLAYLSADYHQHPTAQLMVELFERHDRSRFEVTAFAFGPDDNSAMRARLVAAFDSFEDVRGMSDISSIHVFSHANSGMLSIGSGTVDQTTLATHASQLTPGEAVTAYLKIAGTPVSGVIVPASAVLRYQGADWVYVQTTTNRFTREFITLDQPVQGGWLVSAGLAATDHLVITGAQSVLSAELSSGGFSTGQRD
jgi:hypothetical protein